jgi:hypothetical protein
MSGGTYQVWPPGSLGGAGGGSGPATIIAFSVGSMDGQAASANGASVSSNSIFMQSASSQSSGLVNISAQAFLGQKTFVNAPIFSGFTNPGPFFSNNLGQLVQGSVSLTNQVVGNLPLTQTSGSISLTNQVFGNLPLSQTSGSISLTNQVVGNLPLSQTSGSISLTNQVVGVLPSANLPAGTQIGSVSLTNQVSGILPAANLPAGTQIGSVSLTNQVSGILPAANLPAGTQIGSVSLTNQVSGVLPAANLPAGTQIGSVSLTNQVSGILSFGNISNGSFTSTGANYIVGVNDYILNLTGGGGILPDATLAGNFAKEYVVKYGGSGNNNGVSLLTTSSQTIGGISVGSFSLYSSQEQFRLYSDTANWQVQSHYIPSSWTAYTSTCVSLGSISASSFFWMRQGSDMLVKGGFTGGTAVANIAAIGLPQPGYSINAAFVTRNTTVAQPGAMIGQWTVNSAQASGLMIAATNASSGSLIQVFMGGLNGATTMLTPQNGNIWGNALNWEVNFRVPIAGWIG